MSGGVTEILVTTVVRRLLQAQLERSAKCGYAPFSIALQEFSSQEWASATFEGHRHRFVVRLVGEENAVDRMARQLEEEFERDDCWGSDLILAHIDRTDTDKVLDGEGAATTRLTFEALTILP